MHKENHVNLEESRIKTNPLTWVEEYADYLYRFAMSRLRDEEVARDLVQDTFLAALQKLDSFEGGSQEKTWLTGILKHKIADYYRKQSSKGLAGINAEDVEKEQQDFFDVPSGHWNNQHRPATFGLEEDNPLLMKELGGILNDCLKKLPGLWYSVFSMKHMDELESELICKDLKLSNSNFWVIMHRTKLNLRACLQKNWD